MTKEHDSKQAGLLGNSGEHIAIPHFLSHTGWVPHHHRRRNLSDEHDWGHWEHRTSNPACLVSCTHTIRSCHIPFPERQMMLHHTRDVTEPIWKSQMPTATAKPCHPTAAVPCPIETGGGLLGHHRYLLVWQSGEPALTPKVNNSPINSRNPPTPTKQTILTCRLFLLSSPPSSPLASFIHRSLRKPSLLQTLARHIASSDTPGASKDSEKLLSNRCPGQRAWQRLCPVTHSVPLVVTKELIMRPARPHWR